MWKNTTQRQKKNKKQKQTKKEKTGKKTTKKDINKINKQLAEFE